MEKTLMPYIKNRSIHYKADHSKFGGVICQSDFDTEHRCKSAKNVSSIAQRIMSDMRFDEQCRRNIETRNNRRI